VLLAALVVAEILAALVLVVLLAVQEHLDKEMQGGTAMELRLLIMGAEVVALVLLVWQEMRRLAVAAEQELVQPLLAQEFFMLVAAVLALLAQLK
jgi:hypothetical protein